MEQGALTFTSRDGDISDDIVQRCRSLKHAIKLCIEVSGLPLKDVAFQLDVAEKSLSRMLADNPDDHRNFPPELINKLMDVCHNEIPLRFQALTRGYGLHRLKSALELEVERLKGELAWEKEKRQAIQEFLRESKP